MKISNKNIIDFYIFASISYYISLISSLFIDYSRQDVFFSKTGWLSKHCLLSIFIGYSFYAFTAKIAYIKIKSMLNPFSFSNYILLVFILTPLFLISFVFVYLLWFLFVV